MAGVVRFGGNGVMEFVKTPEPSKLLVYTPTNEIINSYAVLERKLSSLGWERYSDDPDRLQFHRSSTDFISLPRDFSQFKSTHMFDIVVKNRNMFIVRDI